MPYRKDPNYLRVLQARPTIEAQILARLNDIKSLRTNEANFLQGIKTMIRDMRKHGATEEEVRNHLEDAFKELIVLREILEKKK